MTAEKYLQRIKQIDAIIVNKLNDHKRWVELAEGLGGFSVSERVQSSRNLYKIPDAIGRYIDIENEISALKRERQAIIKTIERLPPTEYDLIYKLYVQDYTMKEIAYHRGKSYEWVKIKKRVALRLVQGMIDEG
jgi:DNA-directed RNA polymerase specialized sigma24 family protein